VIQCSCIVSPDMVHTDMRRSCCGEVTTLNSHFGEISDAGRRQRVEEGNDKRCEPVVLYAPNILLVCLARRGIVAPLHNCAGMSQRTTARCLGRFQGPRTKKHGKRAPRFDRICLEQ
jgi:hypothetical protein